jgi:PAS domain S-box-containing protein
MVKPMSDTLTLSPHAERGDTSDAFDEIPVAYVEVDREGVITRANRAARAFHPEVVGDLVGRSAFEFSPADESLKDRNAYLAMMESGADPPVTRRTLYGGTGEYRTYELHRKLIRDREGRPTGVRTVTIDVTETQIAQDEARQARLWLESALASVVDAVILTDALGFVRNMNPAAEKLFACSAAASAGKPIETVLPVLRFPNGDAGPLDFSVTLEKHSRTTATMLDQEQMPVTLEISTSPIRDKETGSTLGVVIRWRLVEPAV